MDEEGGGCGFCFLFFFSEEEVVRGEERRGEDCVSLSSSSAVLCLWPLIIYNIYNNLFEVHDW